MIVSEIMEKEFLTVSEDWEIERLAQVFLANEKDYALVVNKEGELTGIVTETDLIFQEKRVHIPTVFTFLDSMIFLESMSKFNEEIKKISATKVKEIMSSEIVTINENKTVNDAATIMLEKDIHHLPVLRDKKPIGIVTKKVLLKAFLKDREKKS